MIRSIALLTLALASCSLGGPAQPEDIWVKRLRDRKPNYPAALRTATLRLTGDLPTVEQIEALSNAGDPAATYSAQVQALLADDRAQGRVLDFWRNAFKMGGPGLDTAPLFATLLTTSGRPYTELLTATTGNCPTFDGTTITPQDCGGGAPQAGVLGNPEVMRHYYSNMAFRRVRWIQETFACLAFPAEVAQTGLDYTSPWAIETISGADNGGRVNFHDMSGVVCANCHTTMNHIAPLVAPFDMNGTYQAQFSVPVPIEGNPLATRLDYLPEGEPTAWRLGVTAQSLPELGAAMAADPAIAECAVARAWNFAFGHGDVVDSLSTVPKEVIASQIEAFVANGHRFDKLLENVFLSEDFILH
jgi:hypothetical protein